MIIDMHTHVYPEKIAKRAVEKLSKAADIPAQSNGMKSGLQESMKRAGVDYSLLLPVATSVKQVDKMNQEAVAAIAKKAAEKKTGARALRAIIEEFMLDIMYEIPKDDLIGRVTITKDYIEHHGSPKIEMRESGEATLLTQRPD